MKRKTTSQLGVDAKPLGANEGKQKVCVGSKHIHTTVYKIDNKYLLYSRRNSAQYSVMAYMGRASTQKRVYL